MAKSWHLDGGSIVPAKKPQDILSYDIAQAVQYHHVEHKNLQETADLIGVSRTTVKNMKRSETYHELATAAAENLDEPIEKWMESLIDIKNNGENERNKLTATMKGLDIFGAEPPRREEHAHTFQAMGDEELRRRIEDSVNGQIAGTPNAGGLIETATSQPESAVVEGQQPPRTDASEKK